MKKISFLIFIFSTQLLKAQIYLSNSNFEGIPISGSSPPQWNNCILTPDTNPINLNLYPWFISAFEGSSYLGLQTDSSSWGEYHESSGQILSCSLIPKKEHLFNLGLYSIVNNLAPEYKFGGIIKIFGGFSQCDLDTVLWQSPVLDTIWKQYSAEFTPSKAYKYFTIEANNIDNLHSYIGIDALSEITVEDYSFFTFPNTDTTINAGSCVSFPASSDDSTAVFYWSTAAGDSIATADSINVCPTTTTTYIGTATLGCGQQFKDSVKVTVLGGGSSGTPIIKIPNLLSADNPLWQIINATSSMQVTIYNTLGQLVYIKKEYNNTLSFTQLAAATYFYEVKYGSNTYRGKLIVVR